MPTSSSGSSGLSLTAKLVLVTVGLVLLTLLVTTVLSTQSASNGVTQQTRLTLSNKADNLGQLVGLFLQDKLNQIQTITLAPGVHDGTKSRNASYKGADAANINQIQQLDTRWRNAKDNDSLIVKVLSTDDAVNTSGEPLADLVRRFPEQTEVFTTDRLGATIASTGRLSDYYQADEEWWTAAWNDGKGAVYISNPEFDESANINAVLISAPIVSDEDENIGVIRTTLNVNTLFELLKDQTFGESSEVLLVDQTGKILVSSAGQVKEDTKVPAALNPALSSKEASFITTPNTDGADSIFALAPVTAPGVQPNWSVVLRQNTSVAFAAAADATRIGVIAAIIAAVVASLLAFALARSITQPIGTLAQAASRLAQGDFAVQVPVTSADEVGRLAQTFNFTAQQLRNNQERQNLEATRSKQLQDNVSSFLDVAMDISMGDFTKRGKVSEDALGNVVDSINLMVEELGQTLGDVRAVATQVNQNAAAVLDTTDQIQQGATVTAQATQKVAQQVQLVTGSVRQTAQNAQTAAQAAAKTLEAAEQGRQAVTNTLEGMQGIRREVQDISKRIRSLGDRSLEISTIVSTITEIADQTNLLALNAAVEAAGSGQAGSRFAVVAAEVRKLASSAAAATNRIETLVKTVQSEIQEVVVSVEEGTRQVESGYRIATVAGDRLSEISTIAQQSAQLAQAISAAAPQVVQGVEQVNQTVQTISSVAGLTQQNVGKGRQTAEALNNLAADLSESLSRFKLEEA
jgi:methyl-accepting chemotaxis protein